MSASKKSITVLETEIRALRLFLRSEVENNLHAIRGKMWSFKLAPMKMKILMCFLVIHTKMTKGAVTYHGDDTPRSRYDARRSCEGRGYNLASFTSQDDINEMKNVMTDQSHFYWTGLMFTHSTRSWGFIDGADTTFAMTKITAQTYHSNQCVMIRGDGTLNPTHCTEARRYICQHGRHPAPTDPPNSSG